MKPPQYTYRALLGEEFYFFISFGEWGLSLFSTNQRPVHCGKCASQFPVGECIRHKMYKSNYYICLPCAKNLILLYGVKGFFVNFLSNLQPVEYNEPEFTAQQVADSITRFAFTTDENGLIILHSPGE
jgi:hypothetical protein